MRFTHREGPESCDPSFGPGYACDSCWDAWLAAGNEDREGETCRCEPGDRHPLCPEHGEEHAAYECEKKRNRQEASTP